MTYDLTFAYWNTKKIDALGSIIEIIIQENPNIFFLSEVDNSKLLGELSNLNLTNYELFENPGCDRVVIVKRKDIVIKLGLQNRYYTVVKIEKENIFVVSLHLPSQMWQSMDALKEFIRDLRQTLDDEIGCSTEVKILLIGDFNVNPYESPMINYDGFVSTNSPKARKRISHLQKTKTTYYNPTWQLYARHNFPGTKKFNRPSASSYDVIEFHFLDQVLVSQKLVDSIERETIDIIERTENYNFFNNKKNKVELSDHLPLTYKIKLK